MKTVVKTMVGRGIAWLTDNAQGCAIDIVKIRATIWYLRAVRTARGFYLLNLVATLGTMLAGAGFVLLHIGLYLLLPAPANAITLVGLGVIYIVAGLLIVGALSAEKRWLKASGAKDVCASLTGRQNKG